MIEEFLYTHAGLFGGLFVGLFVDFCRGHVHVSAVEKIALPLC